MGSLEDIACMLAHCSHDNIVRFYTEVKLSFIRMMQIINHVMRVCCVNSEIGEKINLKCITLVPKFIPPMLSLPEKLIVGGRSLRKEAWIGQLHDSRQVSNDSFQ